jgi:isopentenyldiphosphate isomerase
MLFHNCEVLDITEELAEELGISDIQLELVGKTMIETDDEREIVAVFKGVHEGPFTYPEDEVENVQFFSPDEVKKIISITPASMSCLKLLNIL